MLEEHTTAILNWLFILSAFTALIVVVVVWFMQPQFLSVRDSLLSESENVSAGETSSVKLGWSGRADGPVRRDLSLD